MSAGLFFGSTPCESSRHCPSVDCAARSRTDLNPLRVANHPLKGLCWQQQTPLPPDAVRGVRSRHADKEDSYRVDGRRFLLPRAGPKPQRVRTVSAI